MHGEKIELTVRDAARMVAKELKDIPPKHRGPMRAWAPNESASTIAFSVFVGAAVLLLALGTNYKAESNTCFRTCELQTIGREFESPAKFSLVHRCAKHDREHFEPIPERVYFEMRDKGIPELRR